MNHALVTGLNGRLAPYLRDQLEALNIRVTAFNRELLDIRDRDAQCKFIARQQIDCVFHLATGPESWAGVLAGVAYELDIPFVLTSTESVFNPDSEGPFTPGHPADADGDYGLYKIAAENVVRNQNPNAIIARLGWQMFDTFDNDNLLTHVRDMVNDEGVLFASTQWKPAVAFIGHTMEALIHLAKRNEPGTYHIGGNENGLTFFELVQLVNRKHQCNWNVQPSTDPSRDGRIIDDRVPCGQIETVLK